jgi:UDP-N-acetylmuramyl pentapeptide phosphotransferase/UDP-N-acetylglucosamine-1-phosphate transferase
MNNLFFWLIPLIVFLLSWKLSLQLIMILQKKGLIDLPNSRSSHIIPTPRGGGLAILLTFFIFGFLSVAAAGFLDDKIGLPVTIRFLIYTTAALLIYFETGGLSMFPLPEPFNFETGWLNLPLTLVWIVAVVNIYNFLDGIDGVAATQTVLASLGFILIDPTGPGFYMGTLLMASTFGFLLINWHPARLFMGDIGSASIGFFFASLPFYLNSVSPHLAVYSTGFFLWFFLADGAFTICRRLIKGEKIWVAHRSHLYQQLVIAGWSHSKVVILVMGMGFILILAYLYSYHYHPGNLILLLPVAVSLFLLYFYQVIRAKKKVENNMTDA